MHSMKMFQVDNHSFFTLSLSLSYTHTHTHTHTLQLKGNSTNVHSKVCLQFLKSTTVYVEKVVVAPEEAACDLINCLLMSIRC